MKITIVGAGYVGLSLAVLLSQKHEVAILEIDKNKIKQINNKESPFKDKEIEEYFSDKKLNLIAYNNKNEAYKNSEYIIISTPTNYDISTNSFDTSSVESVIEDILCSNNHDANIVIKSTVPFGFTDKIRKKYKINRIFFSPEFLRESSALFDNLYPSRVVVGDITDEAKTFANILVDCALKEKSLIPILLMNSNEAESVKLFSNTFLALRIAFFNELDSFSEAKKISSKSIIDGVSSDPRIGNYYNNPSFGYGGYCLPKDTQQLINNYENIPNNIINSIVDSNATRKSFILDSILKRKPKNVGIYRLIMKDGSDNFRESAVLDIIDYLKLKKINIVLFEPLIDTNEYNGIRINNDFNEFAKEADLIIANRLSIELNEVKSKVYSRDIFNIN